MTVSANREQVRAAIHAAGLSNLASDAAADAVMALLAEATEAASCPHVDTSDEGTSYCRLAESPPPSPGRFRVGHSHRDRTLYDGDKLIGCVDPGYGPMIVNALNGAEAPQPRVLWEGETTEAVALASVYSMVTACVEAPEGTRVALVVIEDGETLAECPVCVEWAGCPPADHDCEDTETPAVEAAPWRCPRCGSPRWVAASLTGPVSLGGKAIRQCVPCGHYSNDPVPVRQVTETAEADTDG